MARDGGGMILTDHAGVVATLRSAGCVFAEDEAALLVEAAASAAELDVLVRRRAAGEPLEHVLGWAEFRGLRVAVGPGVFVPRRRTELLVELAVALARPGALVVDVCCGSGAVGLAIATGLGDAELYAADVDPACTAIARRNLAPVGGRVFTGDLLDPLPASLRGGVDVLACNAPYVPTREIELMPPEARLHEPRVALDGGADGLDVLRRVVDAAPDWLSPGGHLLFETGERQVRAMTAHVAARGMVPDVVRDEDALVVTGTL